MNIEKKKEFIVNILFYSLIAFGAYLILRFARNALMPFIIAALIGLIVRPLIKLLTKRLPKVNKKIIAVLIVTIFFLLLCVIMFFFGVKIADRLTELYVKLPKYYKESIEPAISAFLGFGKDFISHLNPNAGEFAISLSEQILNGMNDLISAVSVKFLSWATGFATGIPGSMVSIIICIVSTFFISADYELILANTKKLFSPKTLSFLTEVRKGFYSTIGRYLKSYMIIMSITFVELTIGMLILGVENPLLTAFLIAILDILPILGTGTVLNPWALICLIRGYYLRAILIFGIYLTITFVRNIIEPKIIGGEVGLHPLVTLISMIAGYKLIGAIGLIAFPVALALLNELNKNGVIKINLYSASEKEL